MVTGVLVAQNLPALKEIFAEALDMDQDEPFLVTTKPNIHVLSDGTIQVHCGKYGEIVLSDIIETKSGKKERRQVMCAYVTGDHISQESKLIFCRY